MNGLITQCFSCSVASETVKCSDGGSEKSNHSFKQCSTFSIAKHDVTIKRTFKRTSKGPKIDLCSFLDHRESVLLGSDGSGEVEPPGPVAVPQPPYHAKVVVAEDHFAEDTSPGRVVIRPPTCFEEMSIRENFITLCNQS